MSSPSTNQKKENPVAQNLLENCVENGDDANAKLAQEALENSKKMGMEDAMKILAQNCFKHPETGTPLSYSEMRMFYG